MNIKYLTTIISRKLFWGFRIFRFSLCQIMVKCLMKILISTVYLHISNQMKYFNIKIATVLVNLVFIHWNGIVLVIKLDGINLFIQLTVFVESYCLGKSIITISYFSIFWIIIFSSLNSGNEKVIFIFGVNSYIRWYYPVFISVSHFVMQ